MKFLLTVYFLIGGMWVPGDYFDGWGTRLVPTHEQCLEMEDFGNNKFKPDVIDRFKAGGIDDLKFECRVVE